VHERYRPIDDRQQMDEQMAYIAKLVSARSLKINLNISPTLPLNVTEIKKCEI